MSILAAIDIGTNSTRLLILDIERGKINKVLESHLKTTRIGEGLSADFVLRPEAMNRTLEALRVFEEIAEQYNCQKVRVVATSAVRDAKNREEFQKLVRDHTNLEVDVIDGEEEAFLSYLGVVKGLGTFGNNSIVVDVGGGSTELIWTDEKKGTRFKSVAVGAVRMTQGKHNSEEIQKILQKETYELACSQCQVIGVGGSITTLAAVDQGLEVYDPKKVHGYVLSYNKIKQIREVFESCSLEDRRKIPGLQPERADIIIAGTRIWEEILKSLNVKSLTVSETDLLYGIIFELEKIISLTNSN